MDKLTTKNRPSTTAVIVTYNSRGHINNALEAFYPAYQDGLLDCVVVDNHSVDGTADHITTNYPWVRLVRSNRNLGFGRGCNLGFAEVRTRYVLLANPDAVIDRNTLQTLVQFLDAHQQAGIVAPAIVNDDGSLQQAGMMITPRSLLRLALGLHPALPHKRVITPGEPAFATPWVCGAAMLVRSSLFRRLGGFDPRFFLYFEETDFCRRATAAGVEIWAAGEAVARHLGGACARTAGQPMASSCIVEHYSRSRFYYLVKHFGWLQGVTAETVVRIVYHLRRWVTLVFPDWVSAATEKPGPFLRFPEKTQLDGQE